MSNASRTGKHTVSWESVQMFERSASFAKLHFLDWIICIDFKLYWLIRESKFKGVLLTNDFVLFFFEQIGRITLSRGTNCTTAKMAARAMLLQRWTQNRSICNCPIWHASLVFDLVTFFVRFFLSLFISFVRFCPQWPIIVASLFVCVVDNKYRSIVIRFCVAFSRSLESTVKCRLSKFVQISICKRIIGLRARACPKEQSWSK